MSWTDGEPYVDEVAPGVFAFVQPDGSWMINNTGFLVGGDGRSVLVDTSSTQARTQRYLDEVRRRAPGEPVALVNTHHHPDHTFGNFLAPTGTPIVAHELCREEVVDAGLEATKVVTQPDYGDLELRPPNVTFADRLTLWLDDEPVELIFAGPGHTSNDVVVWVPRTRTVFAGDLCFNGGQPFLVEGSVVGYPAALERIRALNPETLVPGHGQVLRGAEVGASLDDLEGYGHWVLDLARLGRESGQTPLETALDNRDNPYAHWQEGERLVGNLVRAYSELAGDPAGTKIGVPQVWPDMMTFHGGPIHTHA